MLLKDCVLRNHDDGLITDIKAAVAAITAQLEEDDTDTRLNFLEKSIENATAEARQCVEEVQ